MNIVASKTAILYARVSQDSSGEARSVTEQLDEGQGWCEREGVRVVGVYVDNSVSASRYSRKRRPDWERATEHLRRKRVDYLVAWEPSRASRDVVVWGPLLRTCQDQGTSIVSRGRVLDPRNSSDYFSLGLDFLLADKESAQTSERVQRNVNAQAEAGKPHGARPYGYARRYEATTRGHRLVAQEPHPEEGPVVAEIIRRLAAGESLYRVAADLNSRGVPGPRTGGWSPQQVRRMALSPTNIGVRVHKGTQTPGTWPPLVPEATYWAVVERLTAPERKTNEGRGAVHLLSGLARCATCGGPLYVAKQTSAKIGAYNAYACRDRHVTRRQDPVDEQVREAVIFRLTRPDLLDTLAGPDRSEERRAAADDVARLRASLAGWYEAAAEGKITPDGLSKIESGLLVKIAEAERRARPTAAVPPVIAEVAGPLARERWERLALEQRREVIDLLFTITVEPVGKGTKGYPEHATKIVPAAA